MCVGESLLMRSLMFFLGGGARGNILHLSGILKNSRKFFFICKHITDFLIDFPFFPFFFFGNPSKTHL